MHESRLQAGCHSLLQTQLRQDWHLQGHCLSQSHALAERVSNQGSRTQKWQWAEYTPSLLSLLWHCLSPSKGRFKEHSCNQRTFFYFNIFHNNFVFHRFLYPRGYCPSERSSLQLPHPHSRATCMSKVCQEAFAKANFMAFFSNLLRHYLSVLQPDGVRNNWQIRTLGETVKQIRAWGKHPFLRVLQELGAVRYPPWPLCLGTTGTSLRDKKTIYRIIMNSKGKGADNSATNSYNFIQFQCLLEHVVYDIF